MKPPIALLTSLLIHVSIGTAEEPAKRAANADSEELKLGKERLQQCRDLYAGGKEDEAMKLAEESIDVFVAPYPPLRSLAIGVINTEKYRIEVHINTSEAERADTKPPINRPYSFLVYSLGEKTKYLYSLDFEHGHDEGKLVSAALGRTKKGHINYGMIAISANFSEVKKRALDIIGAGIEGEE